MVKRFAALWAAAALLCAPTIALAQIAPNPSSIFVQSCNGGLGGFVGSTYSGQVCGLPGSGGQQTVALATALTLTAGSASTPVNVVVTATYGFAYIVTGTSPSVVLQVLGPDGSTYQNVGSTITATGSQAVVIFAGAAGAVVRLLNTGSNSVTLTAKLVS